MSKKKLRARIADLEARLAVLEARPMQMAQFATVDLRTTRMPPGGPVWIIPSVFEHTPIDLTTVITCTSTGGVS